MRPWILAIAVSLGWATAAWAGTICPQETWVSNATDFGYIAEDRTGAGVETTGTKRFAWTYCSANCVTGAPTMNWWNNGTSAWGTSEVWNDAAHISKGFYYRAMIPSATVSGKYINFYACGGVSPDCSGTSVQIACVVFVHPSTRVETTVAGRTLDVTTTGEGAIDLNNVSGLIDADMIAAGAIGVSEAPLLDVAISSRLAPTTAGRTLDVTAANQVAGVVLTDTVTTYTGNTPQTGDVYALANGASGFAAIAAYIDTEIGTLITRLPYTLPALVGGRMDSDVGGWNGTAVATPYTAGIPRVHPNDGTGTGDLDTVGGAVIVGDMAAAVKKQLGFWGTVTVATAFAGDSTTAPYITSTSFSSALAKAYEGLVVACAEEYLKVERFDPATDKVVFPAGRWFSATPTGTCDVYVLGVR
jgi:hypothetical protein